MPSDRGTLPRAPAGGAEAHPTWPEPTAPAARRLPGAPRARRPALAALAVLLILGGALGAGFLVVQSAQRVTAIEVTEQASGGEHIPLSAMRPVQIAAGTGLGYVPWDEAAQVARFYTVSAIPPGTLLTRGMVTATGPSLAGRAVLGLALKDGQLPRGLAVGDDVDIYQVSDAQETCPGSPGALLASGAVVLSVAAPAADSGSSAQADVQVAVSPADAGPVACNAANGIVGIVVLPGGSGATGAAQSGAAQSGAAQSGITQSEGARPRRVHRARPGSAASGRPATGATPGMPGTADSPPSSPAASGGTPAAASPSPGGAG